MPVQVHGLLLLPWGSLPSMLAKWKESSRLHLNEWYKHLNWQLQIASQAERNCYIDKYIHTIVIGTTSRKSACSTFANEKTSASKRRAVPIARLSWWRINEWNRKIHHWKIREEPLKKQDMEHHVQNKTKPGEESSHPSHPSLLGVCSFLTITGLDTQSVVGWP